ncbi:MAG TPA: hypothetical protein VHL09_06805 [Dehalococcoidia bacterium]|nr:hypothetical protein [Dehalococcoidia bacterium]
MMQRDILNHPSSPHSVIGDGLGQHAYVSIRRFVTPEEALDGTTGWVDVTSGPARLTPAGPVWVATLPPLTDVTVKDQLTTGSETFEVVGVLGPWSRELPRRAVCRRI